MSASADGTAQFSFEGTDPSTQFDAQAIDSTDEPHHSITALRNRPMFSKMSPPSEASYEARVAEVDFSP
jgi:hypothetical protein